MRSLWNPNRFLRSVSPAFWGNPQPTISWKKAFVRSVFNSRNRARRKVHPIKFWLPKSAP